MMSLVQGEYCEEHSYDPMDPRCPRLIMSGDIVKVTDETEKAFAKDALFTRHPAMEYWPEGRFNSFWRDLFSFKKFYFNF